LVVVVFLSDEVYKPDYFKERYGGSVWLLRQLCAAEAAGLASEATGGEFSLFFESFCDSYVLGRSSPLFWRIVSAEYVGYSEISEEVKKISGWSV